MNSHRLAQAACLASALALASALGACTVPPAGSATAEPPASALPGSAPLDTNTVNRAMLSRLPPNAYGGGLVDPDTSAINNAAYAFASPARTRNNPGEAARAAASVDYLAGELNYSPRWDYFPPTIKLQMVQARQEVRGALGIPQDAPSQAVVDGLLGVTRAAYAHDGQAAVAAVSSPVFTLGPQATLARLSNLPFLPTANIATVRANAAQDGSSEGGRCTFGCS